MIKALQTNFIYSVAVILFITAAAKLFATTGTGQALNYPDPILPLANRQMFFLMAGIELIVSAFLLVKNDGRLLKLALIACLATNLLGYRAGLWWEGAPDLCNCLGNLNDRLSISTRTLNFIMGAVLAWLLGGSYLLIILNRFDHTQLPAPRVVNPPAAPK